MKYVEVDWFMQDCFISIHDFGDEQQAQLTKEEADAFAAALVAGTNWEIDDDVALLHWQHSQRVLMVGTLVYTIPPGGVFEQFHGALVNRKRFDTKVDENG